MTASTHRPHFPALDGIRGLSIFLVLVGHVGQWRLGAVWTESFAALGVVLFFVLSGFLITDGLVRTHRQTGTIDLRAFYIRRFLRLGPAFVFFLAALAMGIASGWVTDVPWYGLASSVLYLRNIFGRGDTDAHLWSLSTEEQFYAFWPLLLLIIPRRRWALCAGVLMTLVIGARTWAVFAHVQPVKIYLRPWFRMDAILAGCLLALVMHSRAEGWLRAVMGRVGVAVPLALTLAWALLARDLPAVLFTGETLLSLFVVGGGVYLSRSALSFPLFTSAPAVWLGRLSYSLYLWQQPFLVTRDPDWGLLRELPWCLVPTFALACASYFWIERPFLALKSRLEKGDTRPVPPKEAVVGSLER